MVVNNFCEVYLIRHGETDSNAQGIIQGQTDVPLNAVGREQAETLQKKLAPVVFSAIFSSDLSRARLTAEIVRGSRDVPIRETKDLRERCLQQWETHKRTDLEAVVKKQGIIFSELSQEALLSYKLPPGGIESCAEIYQRFASFIQAKAVDFLGKTILLSSHGGILKSVLYKKEHIQGRFWSVPNCSYLVLRAYADGSIELVKKDGPKSIAHVPYP